MEKRKNNSARASALRIIFSVALVFAFALWLAISAETNRRNASVEIPLAGCPTLGNYPNTTISLSTDTTVTPDATPGITQSISVSSLTDFDGTLVGDLDTGVVRVTNAHPAGAYPVTVTAFNLYCTAIKTFQLTVTTPVTCIPVSFAPATNFGADASPQLVAVGDFNGDGNQDLAVANFSSTVVSILLGNGAGNFSGPTNFNAGSEPFSIAVGDFNGDGNQDLAVANDGDNNVSILLGDGNGNFSAPTNFPVGGGPMSVAVGDFNGDGNQDLAVANFLSHNVSILVGDGAGNFSGPTNFGVGNNAISVVVGDFNDDGNQDLAVANAVSLGTVSILLGNGNGTFQPAVNYAAGSFPSSVAVGDFNHDGNQDLAVANFSSNNVSILLGNGNGTFQPAVNFNAGTGPNSVAVGDFNGDGNQDLAVANDLSNNVSILLGDGSGNFSGATNFGVGSNPMSVAVGDFNGDAKQDLASANNGSGDVSILLRNCAPTPTPTPTPTCTPFWFAGPNVPSPIVRAVGVYFPANGKFYAMGGRSSDAAGSEFTHPFEYDPASNSWTIRSATYSDNQTNDMACGVLTDTGTPFIYCAGGSAAGQTTATGRVFTYNPITDAIGTFAFPPWPPGTTNVLPGGFSVFNNKLYILGGFDMPGGVATNQIWEFTPTSNVWVQKSAVLPFPRGFIPTTTIGSFIYTGGGAAIISDVITDAANSFRYDPTADTISIIASMPRPTGETRALNFNNKMFVMGGGRNAPNPSNEVDVYDPTSNTWFLGQPFVTARRNFPTDTDGTARIWLAGGYAPSTPTNTMEIFACPAPTATPTATATFTPTPTATFTPTSTATFTPTSTATITATPTATATATAGFTPTVTPTASGTPTVTPTATFTPRASITPRPRPSPSSTARPTPGPTATPRVTPYPHRTPPPRP